MFRKLALCLLALALSACLEVPTPPAPVTLIPTATSQPTSTPAPSATPEQTAIVQAYVLQVRDEAGIVRNWLKLGDVVTVMGCKDKFCHIRTNGLTGYVWQGCLTGQGDGLGCQAK